MQIPDSIMEQKQLLRALMNVRSPLPISNEVIQIQDEYLQSEVASKGITGIEDLNPIKDNLYLWQGDITTIKCDAIVNAANSAMLGCFQPCHGCIDNAIHTYSGMQLRLACEEIMEKQGGDEPTGGAKITSAYNLPSRYILHTVGPIVSGLLTETHKQQLESCYVSCLKLAQANHITSISFCCISTGEFHFPNEKAAEIAVKIVQKYQSTTQSEMKVIFNVFKEIDYEIYQRLLGTSE